VRNVLRILFCFVLFALPAFGAGPVKFGIHGGVGALNMPEPIKPAYGFGYGGGLHLDLSLVVVSFRVSGDYHVFPVDENQFRTILMQAQPNLNTSGFSVSGGSVKVLSVGVNGKFSFPIPIVSPYVTAGVGYSNLEQGDLTVTYQGQPLVGVPTTSSVNKATLNAGVGVDLNLVFADLFVEARYVLILAEGFSPGYVPITVGLTF